MESRINDRVQQWPSARHRSRIGLSRIHHDNRSGYLDIKMRRRIRLCNRLKRLAEASGSRTHRRRDDPPSAGFEDREIHRNPCASVLVINSLKVTLSCRCIFCCTNILNLQMSMSRHQAGYIFESASGAFHVRFYTTEIIDGQARRVQKLHLLCRHDNKPTPPTPPTPSTPATPRLSLTCRFHPRKICHA
jgi:hypothetical protein